MLQITPENIQKLKQALPLMPDKEKRRVAELLKQYQNQVTQKLGKDHFLDFIGHVYPGYKVGPHHKKLARIFEEIAEGKKKRVIVNIAPRHGKSEMISYLAPAWLAEPTSVFASFRQLTALFLVFDQRFKAEFLFAPPSHRAKRVSKASFPLNNASALLADA